MLKVIVNGSLGKMGRVLTSCIKEDSNLDLVCGVSKYGEEKVDYKFYKEILEVEEKCDVIIDFSHPSSLDSILEYATRTKTALVIATTGYNEEELDKIKEASKEIAIFNSSNMSLGVNVLLKLVKDAAKALDGFDIEVIEKHHNKKVDAPSGTALMIANSIKEVLPQVEYNYGRYGRDAKRKENELGIHAIRGGTIVGDHDVVFAGNNEIIEISHKAQSKEVFAQGSIKAAKYIVTKQPGYYNMSNMIGE
jgi:4-hydroxy-tetrahydrodipicolinate reductase